MPTTSKKEFKDLKLLTINVKFDKCINSTVFKFTNGNCPYYLNEVFKLRP